MKQDNFDHIEYAETRAVIEETALHGDPVSQYNIGRSAMLYNKIGFGWIFIKLAAQGGHPTAKKCLALLEDTDMERKVRIKKCLEMLN